MIRSRAMLVLVSLLVGIIGGTAHANFTLTNNNSLVRVDTSTSHTGVFDWFVDGSNQFFGNQEREWFWIGVGNSAPEVPISALPKIAEAVTAPNIATVRYGSASTYEVEVKFTLSGDLPGSGKSQLGEQVFLKNNSGSAKTFHLYELTDWELGANGLNDTVALTGVSQVGFPPVTKFTTISQFDPVAGASGYVGLSNAADRYAISGTHGTLAALLNDGIHTNFSNMANFAPVTGDAEFVFEWDITLQNGQSTTIGKDKFLQLPKTPEAGSMVLFALGILGAGFTRRFRKT